MVLTESTMLKLGTQAPNFTLYDTISQKDRSLSELKSKVATVIMFICNHCPYVKHIREGLVQIANDYQPKSIRFIAINANDPTSYPDDSSDKMREIALKYNYPFPYLFDKTQEVAKAYRATCTPDFFVFDKNLKLVYRGRFDDSNPGKPDIIVTGKDMRVALDNIILNKPIDPRQKPSMGCNIKWK